MPIFRYLPRTNLGAPQAPQKVRAVNKIIRNGLGGNLDTISAMRQLARSRAKEPAIRALAMNIIQQAGVASHNYRDEALAIGRYIQANMRYLRDIDGVEQLQDPMLMLQSLQKGNAMGDCDDMSLMIATLLISIGAQPYFRTVRYKGAMGPYNHIYVVCYDNNHKQKSQRIVLDAIVKDKPMGYEIPHASGDEYRV